MFSFFKKSTDLGYENLKIKFENLEDYLLEADVSYDFIEKIQEKFGSKISLLDLEKYLIDVFENNQYDIKNSKPFVDVIIGVNGAGKTTSIAKLAFKYKTSSKSVMLCAGDTFRAGAVEQLNLWAKKLDVDIVKADQGADPSSVAYNALQSAMSKNIDHVIIDTAGRLQNQVNLVAQLQKIIRVCKKINEEFPTRIIMIMDSMQGNMAIEQARVFSQAVKIDGIIITKLDGTSKGGALLSIVDELGIAILYIGNGESEKDFMNFDSKEYVKSLIEHIIACENES